MQFQRERACNFRGYEISEYAISEVRVYLLKVNLLFLYIV